MAARVDEGPSCNAQGEIGLLPQNPDLASLVEPVDQRSLILPDPLPILVHGSEHEALPLFQGHVGFLGAGLSRVLCQDPAGVLHPLVNDRPPHLVPGSHPSARNGGQVPGVGEGAQTEPHVNLLRHLELQLGRAGQE